MKNNRKKTNGRNIQYITECLRDAKGKPILDSLGNKTYLKKTKKIVHIE
jgi:hypothetical protein